MNFYWPKIGSTNHINQKKMSTETTESKRNQQNRAQGGVMGVGKPPPGLGGLGGSEVQKERKFGGSEKRGSGRRIVRRIRRTAGALHADLVGRRTFNGNRKGNVCWRRRGAS